MEFREVKQIRKPVYIFEMFGTAIVLMVFNMSRDHLGNDKAHFGHNPTINSLAYFACIVILGDICGGHFNPAVTIGVLIKEGKSSFKKNLPYAIFIMMSQLFGGLLGVLMSFMLSNSNGTTSKQVPMIPLLCPEMYKGIQVPDTNTTNIISICNEYRNTGQIILVEAIGTFVFVNVVLHMKYHSTAGDSLINAFIISISLYAMQLMTKSVSGGCLNPAIGFI